MQYEYPWNSEAAFTRISVSRSSGRSAFWTGGLDTSTMRMRAEQYRDTDPELYNRVRQHIRIESVFPKFALATLHAGKFSDEELLRLRMEVKVDCERIIRKVQEHIEITTVFSEWGL